MNSGYPEHRQPVLFVVVVVSDRRVDAVHLPVLHRLVLDEARGSDELQQRVVEVFLE